MHVLCMHMHMHARWRRSTGCRYSYAYTCMYLACMYFACTHSRKLRSTDRRYSHTPGYTLT